MAFAVEYRAAACNSKLLGHRMGLRLVNKLRSIRVKVPSVTGAFHASGRPRQGERSNTPVKRLWCRQRPWLK
jgi:hypothetical protein